MPVTPSALWLLGRAPDLPSPRVLHTLLTAPSPAPSPAPQQGAQPCGPAESPVNNSTGPISLDDQQEKKDPES